MNLSLPTARVSLAVCGLLGIAFPARAEPSRNWHIQWPDAELVWRVLTLQSYGTRLVVLSTALLGLAAGVVGSFMLLRKRSLMGDALSHATLPGIGLMFIVMVLAGGSGRTLGLLLLGATITGLIGVGTVLLIRNTTRLKDDAAMGLVLSVFFGLGIAIMGIIQDMPAVSAAGLKSFIYGKTASVLMQDFVVIGAAAVVVLVVAGLLFKEFKLLCFDEGYAASMGWPVHRLDMLMLSLVALVTVVGLQAVGLILIIAFLITPAAAARFWTNDLRWMTVLAALLGAASGWIGASISAMFSGFPAGALIVLVGAALFMLSMLAGPARGVIPRALAHRRLRRKVGRQHLLRAAYELLEDAGEQGLVSNVPIPFGQLLAHRSWTAGQLRRLIRTARSEDHIDEADAVHVRLSESGFGEAARITRNHRLWEMYLITHAEIAPSHVDRDADAVEHVLGPDMVRQLEEELRRRDALGVPPSPHMVGGQPG